MDKKKNYLALKKFSQQAGADIFGVADISRIKASFRLSEALLARVERAVCLGLGLSAGILEEVSCVPTRLYFHHYKTANTALDQLAFKVASYIQKKGYLAVPIPASQILDWQNQKGHLAHKQLAYLAGVGWIGRNNLLVNKNLGSQLRLVTILTDMPLKEDQPVKDTCGSCRLCIAACPAQAIKEDLAAFEDERCFAQLKEFQKQRLVDQYICGVCVRVCKGRRRG